MPDRCPAVSGGRDSIQCDQKAGHPSFYSDTWAWDHEAKGRKWSDARPKVSKTSVYVE